MLEELHLQECKITYIGSISLYCGMKKNSKLKILYLDGNNLYGKNMQELASALWNNSSLIKLSMENCQLSDNGCIYLMDGLERNVILQYINIKHNGIG